jgi:hypothetical protein
MRLDPKRLVLYSVSATALGVSAWRAVEVKSVQAVSFCCGSQTDCVDADANDEAEACANLPADCAPCDGLPGECRPIGSPPIPPCL